MAAPDRYARSFGARVMSVMRAVRRLNSCGGSADRSRFSGWVADMGVLAWRSGFGGRKTRVAGGNLWRKAWVDRNRTPVRTLHGIVPSREKVPGISGARPRVPGSGTASGWGQAPRSVVLL